MLKSLTVASLVFLGFTSLSAQASDLQGQFASQFNVARTLAAQYGDEAKKLDKHSTLSAEAGRAFYLKKVVGMNGKDASCSACHTDDPTQVGKHNETGKPVEPMAITANPNRFSDIKKVEKNFRTHCNDLYGKDCSAQDKGDFLTYLLSIK